MPQSKYSEKISVAKRVFGSCRIESNWLLSVFPCEQSSAKSDQQLLMKIFARENDEWFLK